MNKLFKTLLFLLIPGGMLFAQQTDNTGGNAIMQEAQYKTHQLQESLGLTNEQVPKVYQIYYVYMSQLDAFGKNSSSYSDEIKKEKTQEITETRDKQLNDVLTVTQTEQFKKAQEAK